MVTVPGETAANSNPPTLALLALGVTHTGLALAMEGPARRLLDRTALWTVTVFINGVIMSLYLWHATVMVVIVGIAELPGGVGLRLEPNTVEWWATRPVWLLVLASVLAIVVSVVGWAEGQPQRPARAPSAWQSAAGAGAVCIGLVALAATGIGGEGALGIRPGPVLLTLGGAVLVAAARIGRRASGTAQADL
jgi:hypothetical protein